MEWRGERSVMEMGVDRLSSTLFSPNDRQTLRQSDVNTAIYDVRSVLFISMPVES